MHQENKVWIYPHKPGYNEFESVEDFIKELKLAKTGEKWNHNIQRAKQGDVIVFAFKGRNDIDWAVIGHGSVLEKSLPEDKRFKVAYTFKVTSVKVYQRKHRIQYSELKSKLARFKPDARKVVMLSDHDFSMLKKNVGVS